MYAQALVQPGIRRDPAEVVVRGAAVALALADAYIHSTLGGLLFTLNAIGFAVLAVALVAPIGLVVGQRYGAVLRTLVRLGLMGFSAATIGGWVLFGARIQAGYEATAIETFLVVLMAVDIARSTGSPVAVARELFQLVPARVRPSF